MSYVRDCRHLILTLINIWAFVDAGAVIGIIVGFVLLLLILLILVIVIICLCR